ncbi:MAG: NifU family protein [Chitinophagales bacterium]
MIGSKRVVSIYTEATPNPETMKFVLNKMLYAQNSADFPTREDAEGASDLAIGLFDEFPYVKGVFIMNNFVTVTKTPTTEWFEVVPDIREYIRQYVEEEGHIIDENVLRQKLADKPGGDPNEVSVDDSEIEVKIKELIKTYVQPAVEMDGGSIVFRSYNEGIVYLGMQGSCSGCPSSTVTLKAGIEGLMKRMIPEIISVEAEMM